MVLVFVLVAVFADVIIAVYGKGYAPPSSVGTLLDDNTSLPKHLRDSLESAGVSVSPRATITELIERVWEAQERYLQPGSPESPGGALRGGR